MKLTSLQFAVLSAAILLGGSCGKGGSSSNPGGPTPAVSSFSTVASGGEPSDMDWAQLGAQLAGLSANALQEVLAASATGFTPNGLRTYDLVAPTANRTWDASYFCCGTATSYLTLGGQILIGRSADGLGITITQTFSRLVELTWAVPSNSYSLAFPGDGLTMTAQLVTANGRIVQGQEFTLNGQVSYLGGNTLRTATINATFGFRNIEDILQGLTATGQLGPLRLTGQSMPVSAASVSRCSRPREGCGPLVSGNAPCTRWPACSR
jgi:hypothetical protein